MPSVSTAQARLIAADLARKKAGKPTRTGMSLAQLVEWRKADKGKANG